MVYEISGIHEYNNKPFDDIVEVASDAELKEELRWYKNSLDLEVRLIYEGSIDEWLAS